jgi:hypothetical protein
LAKIIIHFRQVTKGLFCDLLFRASTPEPHNTRVMLMGAAGYASTNTSRAIRPTVKVLGLQGSAAAPNINRIHIATSLINESAPQYHDNAIKSICLPLFHGNVCNKNLQGIVYTMLEKICAHTYN